MQRKILWTGNLLICKFALNVTIEEADMDLKEMTYFDFLIREKHKFLRNIFAKER